MYTVWDLLGDAGGLHDALRLAGELVMGLATLFSGSGLDRYLVATLFKVDPKKADRKATYEANRIASRKSARFSLCSCLCAWKDSISARSYRVAEDRIAREIDIVSFLRHQMIDDVARRLLFSRMERYLIRN